MDKLTMHTTDGVNANLERLAALFPNCVTETTDEQGNVRLAVDYDKLRVELGEVVEGNEERYQFTWPGKRDAMRLANSPIAAALRPVREDSVNFDTTQNLYIEGDNLDVLKLLRETYLGKVKMIYIDPPYNTGNDFVYEDDFSQTTGDYLAKSGQYDEQGNRLVINTESNGRFHTDWLNMMYSRLKVARDLLADDGVLFISIGDDEESNLIKICEEIFGEQNFIASICHKHRASVSNDRIISENHNHLIFMAKNIANVFANHKMIGEDPVLDGFNLEDERGKYRLTPVDGPGGAKKGNPHYEFLGVTGYWRYSKETMQQKYNDGLIVRTNSGLQQKYYISQAEKSRRTVTTWWDDDFLTSSATSQLVTLMGAKTFDNPKNVNLLLRCLKMITKFDTDAVILDFFSGSATTAHAVMQLNAEDGGNRRFIMVQLPEETDEKSEARKAGYSNICEIGKERIRRAGKKIKTELEQKADTLSREIDRMLHAKPSATAQLLLKEDLEEIAGDIYKEQILPKQKELKMVEEQLARLDTGFRVLRLDSSNMEDVFYMPKDTAQANLFNSVDNVKPDRTGEDLLIQVMLELGIPLSSKIESESIHGKEVYSVEHDYLIACFDQGINEDTITAIAKRKPQYFVMRDNSMATDNVADNFDQIFKAYSPDTTCKIL